jgi:hypothetical protein
MESNRMVMKRLVLAALIGLLTGGVPALADPEEMSRPARSDSLEIPGLTAGCHVCEWRPKLHQKSAAQECGADDNGEAKIGVFECGFAEDCQRVCHFVRCGTI